MFLGRYIAAQQAFGAFKFVEAQHQMNGVIGANPTSSMGAGPTQEAYELSGGIAAKVTANTITTPSDSATRNSASFITDTSANDHLVVIKSGGKVWDAYVSQKSAANGISDWAAFKAAVAASNPGIADLNNIPADTKLYMPEKFADGSITYNYASGTAINSNAVTGEYHMVVPNADGGQTVYSRTVDVDAGYTVRQISTDRWGHETLNSTGFQENLQSEIRAVGLNWQTDAQSGSSSYDGALRTDAVTNKTTGVTTLTAADEVTGQTQSMAVRSGSLNQDTYNAMMYSTMASFLNALRSKDKLGMALNGVKMIVDTAIYNNKGEVPGDVLSGASKTITGLSATVGIVAGLHALQSHDTQTQFNGAVGLLYSSNSLAGMMGVSNGAGAQGFLSGGQLSGETEGQWAMAQSPVEQERACRFVPRRARHRKGSHPNASRLMQS